MARTAMPGNHTIQQTDKRPATNGQKITNDMQLWWRSLNYIKNKTEKIHYKQ